MLRRALVVLCFGFMTVFMAGCGSSNELQSITIEPSQPNVEGVSSNLPLKVIAHYSNTKTEDVTTRASYAPLVSLAAPAAAISVTDSGILVTSKVPACSWGNVANGPTLYTYFLIMDQTYSLNVTYSGKTAAAIVSVASEAPCYDGIGTNIRLPPTP